MERQSVTTAVDFAAEHVQDRANRGCALPPGTSSSDPGKSGGISDHTG